MKLLIITQKLDRNDPILGFFHRWLEEFAKHTESLIVICLERGTYSLPKNVRVLSLGKEGGKSRLKYLLRFYKYIWQERKNYDAVFVHMNQEYVILGWKFWWLWNKKIFLWRNHVKGGFFTRLAILFSNKVFYTSPQSFTARFKKAIIMPVGIDTNFFKPDLSVIKKPNSILFLGRIAPVKRVLEFIEWFNKLEEKFVATVAGEALPQYRWYEKLVKSRASERIKFIGPVNQDEARKLYQSHETYANTTLAGSFDKAILEAASSETPVIVDNIDLKILEGRSGKELRDFVVSNHSLELLVNRLKSELS